MFHIITDGHHEEDDGYDEKDRTDNRDNRHSLQPEKLFLPEAGGFDIEKRLAGIHHREFQSGGISLALAARPYKLGHVYTFNL